MPDPTPPPPVPRRWRDDSSARPDASGPDRRVIYGLLAAILAMGGAVVGLLNWIRPLPSPFFVPIRVGAYQDRQIPFLPFAGSYTASLGRGYFARTLGLGFPDQEKTVIAATLAGLKDRRPADAVVVLISANARVALDGGVALLPADADPEDPRTWLPLRDVLRALRDCPANHQLLILDIMRPLAPSRLGVLRDDVAARVPDDLKAVDDPRRLVLSACSPGQASFDSEELGRSAFGYYIEEGTRGWADVGDHQGGGDGLVTAEELARYVVGHVERWVRLNRGERQVPSWSGSGEDFPLMALSHSRPRPRLGPPKPAAYPAWLRDGWARRDLWKKQGDDRLLPRAFREAEAALLAAEAEWRGAVDPERSRRDLSDRLDAARSRFDQARSARPPEPRSLAMAASLGATPDPAVSAALAALLAKRAEALRAPKPDPANDPAKLADAFREATKAASDFALARAVFDAAADGDGQRDGITFLDDLLRPRQPQPLYAESSALRRLADLARAPGPGRDGWSAEIALLALQVTRKGEAVEAQPEGFVRLRGALDEANRRRHDGEVLLLAARGYAPIAEAERSLRRALDAYLAIGEGQAMIARAHAEVDEALGTLPAYRPYLEVAPGRADAWLGAVDAAQTLADLLAPVVPDGSGALAPTPPDSEARQALDALRRKVDVLRDRLDDLHAPFAPAGVVDLLARSARPDAGTPALRDLDAILATPFPDAVTRARLWAARSALARKLLDRSLAIDRGEQPDPTPPSGGPEPLVVDPDAAAARRARESIAALGLAGLAPDDLAPLQAALDRDIAARGHPEAWRRLGVDIVSAWQDRLPRQFVRAVDLAARDRIARFFPPFAPSPLPDDPRANPTVQRREALAKALRGWLADRAQDRADDLGGTSFDAITARTYRDRDRPEPIPPVRFDPPAPTRPGLTVEHPAATVAVAFRLATPSGQGPAPTLDVIGDPDWLRVEAEAGAVLDDARRGDRSAETFRLVSPGSPEQSVRLRVERKADGDLAGTPPPPGFLVRVHVGGRDFHHPMDVGLTSYADRPQVLLSADGDRPADPQDSARLRPVDGVQPWFLYVRNPSPRPRNLTVRVLAGGSMVEGGEGTVRLDPRGIGKVAFAAPGPKPDAPLPELKAPLAIRILDADANGAELATVPVAVGIASPSEIARVASIRFDPAGSSGGKNRLAVEIRAAGPIAGPPCVARLVLDRDRIPALLRPGDGTFRVAIPGDGRPVALEARGIGLDPSVDPDGLVVVALDHYDRAFAFRATFATGSSTPRTPEPVFGPAIRVRSDRVSGGASSALPVAVEVDHAPPGATVDLALGRIEAGTFRADITRSYPAPRKTRIGLAVGGPGGPLGFSASVADWSETLDVTGLHGTRLLRARLLDRDGREVRVATSPVILDAIAPGSPRFVGLPAQVKKGSTLVVSAIATPSESGIASASFFVGKPVAGKIPPTAAPVAGLPSDPGRSTWTASLILPDDRKGPLDLGVLFTSAAGVPAFASATVELLDADPIAPGAIRGTVVEGTNRQPNLEVSLSGPSGKTTTKTAPDGTFSFPGLAPGKYKLSAAKPESLTKAEAEVTLTPGAVATPTLELFR